MDLKLVAERVETLAKEKYGNTNKMVEASDGFLNINTVYNMKKDKPSAPNIIMFQKIAELLGVTTDYLMTGKETNLNVIESDITINTKIEKENVITKKGNILEFYKTQSFEEANDMLKNGWEEYGKEMIRDKVGDIITFVLAKRELITLTENLEKAEESLSNGHNYKSAVPIVSDDISVVAVGAGASDGVMPTEALAQALKDIEDNYK